MEQGKILSYTNHRCISLQLIGIELPGFAPWCLTRAHLLPARPHEQHRSEAVSVFTAVATCTHNPTCRRCTNTHTEPPARLSQDTHGILHPPPAHTGVESAVHPEEFHSCVGGEPWWQRFIISMKLTVSDLKLWGINAILRHLCLTVICCCGPLILTWL